MPLLQKTESESVFCWQCVGYWSPKGPFQTHLHMYLSPSSVDSTSLCIQVHTAFAFNDKIHPAAISLPSVDSWWGMQSEYTVFFFPVAPVGFLEGASWTAPAH